MNVIISNKYKGLLDALTIDVIKKMDGEFEVDEIISTFKNFFFQRMIIDITALKDYKDIKTLQKLSISLDMDKLILLLDGSPENLAPDYLSNLISMGIYNFTQNIEGIMYLYNNPNTYRDVAQYHQLNNTVRDEPVMNYDSQSSGPRVIGFKNINKQAGATTLTYMIKKQLEKNYSVITLEVDRRDFSYFREKDMYSTTSLEIGNTIAKYSNNDVILVDINESASAEALCKEVYYLLQPSTLKLNRLMMTDTKALEHLKDKKIILNQSLLNSKDVLDFEYEAKIKVFYNMPPLDDREKVIHVINVFLIKIGFIKQNSEESEKKNKLLGIFNI